MIESPVKVPPPVPLLTKEDQPQSLIVSLGIKFGFPLKLLSKDILSKYRTTLNWEVACWWISIKQPLGGGGKRTWELWCLVVVGVLKAFPAEQIWHLDSVGHSPPSAGHSKPPVGPLLTVMSKSWTTNHFYSVIFSAITTEYRVAEIHLWFINHQFDLISSCWSQDVELTKYINLNMLIMTEMRWFPGSWRQAWMMLQPENAFMKDFHSSKSHLRQHYSPQNCPNKLYNHCSSMGHGYSPTYGCVQRIFGCETHIFA